jgi:hypothetical protein
MSSHYEQPGEGARRGSGDRSGDPPQSSVRAFGNYVTLAASSWMKAKRGTKNAQPTLGRLRENRNF